MKIVITGASGPFGSGVVRGLLAKGVSPSALILVSRRPEKLREFAEFGTEARCGDFDDYDRLVEALAGGERMLMISTNRVGQREPPHTNAVNAAKAAGVKHVVYTSFVGDDQNVSIAVSDHRLTERLLAESGMAWTILRNAQYSEAMRDAGAPSAILRGEWVSSTGAGRMAFVTRDDCVASAAAVMAGEGHAGKTYNITGPELLTYGEVARLSAEISGHPISYREVDEAGMYAFFDSLGVPRAAKDDHVVDGFGWCSDDMVSFEASVRNGSFAIISNDVVTLAGRRPKSMREVLSERREALRAIVPVVAPT